MLRRLIHGGYLLVDEGHGLLNPLRVQEAGGEDEGKVDEDSVLVTHVVQEDVILVTGQPSSTENTLYTH